MAEMTQKGLVLFQGQGIRRVWYHDEWYYSVVDIIAILTNQDDFQAARKYWNKLSQRLREEGSEVVTTCHRLKLLAPDGKSRETDCANTKSLLRIVQSVPSKKAEPLKLWLAQVGHERIQEIDNPELAQRRMKELYKAKGYSDDWVEKRVRGIAIRDELTDEWGKRGVESDREYAILTAEISKATFGLSPSEHKELKGLKKENLRDHMNDLELIFTMLGEASTTKITRKQDAQGFVENRTVAREGGIVAGVARRELERRTGEMVVSDENFLHLTQGKKKRLIK